MYAADLRRTGEYKVRRIVETTTKGPITRSPRNLNELRKILDPASPTPLPIRPRSPST